MSDKAEQRASGARPRRGRGNGGLRGNKEASGVRDQTSTTNKPKEEVRAIKSEDGPERFPVVSRHTSLYKSPVSIDWNEPALCRFFADYTMDTDNLKVNPGFLHNLSLLYNEATSNDELLVQAVKACALANFSNQSRSDHFLIKARSAYGKSLALLHKAQSEGQLTSISTLAAVLLMNMYDVRSPSFFLRPKLTSVPRCIVGASH